MQSAGHKDSAHPSYSSGGTNAEGTETEGAAHISFSSTDIDEVISKGILADLPDAAGGYKRVPIEELGQHSADVKQRD